jgi:hypothetical protein
MSEATGGKDFVAEARPNWEHAEPADHDADPHYAGFGRWVCFACRGKVRLKEETPVV